MQSNKLAVVLTVGGVLCGKVTMLVDIGGSFDGPALTLSTELSVFMLVIQILLLFLNWQAWLEFGKHFDL